MINRKLYLWSTGIGIALIIALVGDAGTINTLITISIMMILFSLYLQSRQRLIKLDQQGNGLGENNVTSTRESLEITTEVKGV